jgi:hypothetical protein
LLIYLLDRKEETNSKIRQYKHKLRYNNSELSRKIYFHCRKLIKHV